jgi:hypothetical protein
VACRTSPHSGWPSTSARVRPIGHPSGHRHRRSVPPRTPGRRWPGDGHGGPLDRPVGRTSPVRGDRPATGSGPGPDSGRHLQRPASDHAAASRPRPTTRPTRPGPDRTGQDRTALRMLAFGQPQQHLASGPVRRDHCTHARCRNVHKPGPRPMCARSCPASTMDATIGQPPDTACPVDPAGHRPLHTARHGKPEATRTRNRRTARKAFGQPDRQ